MASKNKLMFDSKTKARLVGEANFQSINSIINTFKTHISSNLSVTIDLRELINSQTVALSLLLELTRIAKTQKSNVIFTNLPDNLIKIAKLNNIDKFYVHS